MHDSFGLGTPARRPARLGPALEPRAARVGSSAGSLVAMATALVALVAGGFFVVRVVASGGERAADTTRTAVGQIAVAQDLAAQETARRVTLAATATYAGRCLSHGRGARHVRPHDRGDERTLERAGDRERGRL